MKLDLNCDLGEGEAWQKTAALLRAVSSVNIACGGHAGDVQTMRRTVRAALRLGVRTGAHPGLADRTGFGRHAVELSPSELALLILQQVGGLEVILRAEGGRLHHIKLHGALYHMAERSPALRRAYISLVVEFWPKTIVYALAGGAVQREGEKAGLKVWPEGFIDRAYQKDGSLVPRSEPNALLSLKEVQLRLEGLRQAGSVLAGGGELRIGARTWCIHSDSPDALQVARMARRMLSV